jgi:hypothetical protein
LQAFESSLFKLLHIIITSMLWFGTIITTTALLNGMAVISTKPHQSITTKFSGDPFIEHSVFARIRFGAPFPSRYDGGF